MTVIMIIISTRKNKKLLPAANEVFSVGYLLKTKKEANLVLASFLSN